MPHPQPFISSFARRSKLKKALRAFSKGLRGIEMLDLFMSIEPNYLNDLAVGRIASLFFQLYHNPQFDVKLKGVYFLENILPKVFYN